MSGLDYFPDRPAWHDRAACRGAGPAMWFPDRGHPLSVGSVAAKAVCAGCPVRAECGIAGLGERTGIWGGLDGAERRRLRTQVTPDEIAAALGLQPESRGSVMTRPPTHGDTP